MRWRASLVALLLLGAAALWSKISLTTAAFIYTEAPACDLQAWNRGAERFARGARLILGEGVTARILTPRFFAAADPAISFDGRAVLFAGKVHEQDRWSIWELPLAGSQAPKSLFQSPDDCIRPLYLPDDRIVYSRLTPDGWQIETFGLHDGKTLRLTYAPGNFLAADVLQDGRVLFEHDNDIYTVYSDGSGVESYRCDHGTSRAGARQVASGDIVFGQAAGLARFTSAQAKQVALAAPPGPYLGPIAELGPAEWLLPRGRAGLYLWVPGEPAASKIAANGVEPAAVASRTPPQRFPSALHDWDGANLLCLNAYTAKVPITESSIASVRMYSLDASRRPVLLGEAPVESDGSFYLHVPADRPLRMELRDRAARPIQAEHGWFWMRRGEQRVCVGCHAGPERAPDNAVPQVLLKTTTPFPMEGRR